MTLLPTIPVVTGEVRALTLYPVVPHDLGGIRVPDDGFAPHIRTGEIAVVDPDDNEPQAGEIYVVTLSDPREPDGVVLRFVQLRPSGFRFVQEMPAGPAQPDREDSVA